MDHKRYLLDEILQKYIIGRPQTPLQNQLENSIKPVTLPSSSTATSV